ncbi:hypothetical protein G3N92_32115 [Burkholderia sp. Ac-20379]|nr:hypothetical protein [Burkholderia sp. Ac-20379]
MLLLAVASPAFAGDHYVEIWNPPESRGGAHRDRDTQAALPKAQKHKHVAPRLVDAGVRPPALETQKAITKPHVGEAATPHAAPGAPDIPRLFTPDGNVLRVGAPGGVRAQVLR